jgi:hypothetical protein
MGGAGSGGCSCGGTRKVKSAKKKLNRFKTTFKGLQKNKKEISPLERNLDALTKVHQSGIGKYKDVAPKVRKIKSKTKLKKASSKGKVTRKKSLKRRRK